MKLFSVVVVVVVVVLEVVDVVSFSVTKKEQLRFGSKVHLALDI